MKKAGRVALLVAGGILAVFAAALLAVNLYVQSHDTQARIQQELSQRLGATLRIQRISVTPWWGLKLTGITMPQSDSALPWDFLNAETFRLRIRFASLFSGRLVINEISLVRPTIMWVQNNDGQWRLPLTEKDEPLPAVDSVDESAQSNLPATPVQPPSAAQTVPSAPPVDRVAPPETTGPASFTPEIRRVTLAQGSFHFLDAKGSPVATFDGVRFRSSLRKAEELRGNASIAKVSLRNRFFLEDLQSPLRYDPEELDFSGITARAAGGEITGRFSMLPANEDSPFIANLAFHDVQVDRILTEAGGPAEMLQGRIEGRLDANGKTADPNALSGSGEIVLRDGQVRRYSLLVALGQLLQLDELAQLQLDQAQVKYHIAPGVVTIDELLLTSPNIRLTATGTVTFAGKLRLQSQLAINEKVSGKLFSVMRDKFKPIELAGYSAIDFEVGGTIDKPKPNLMGKLIGSELRDLSGMINDLLGGGKTERPPKKKRETRSAFDGAPSSETSPTPSVTPQPDESP